MDLFRYKDKTITDADFAAVLAEFDLNGRAVLCHSRLFSLGRISKRESVLRIIELLKEAVGENGTLCIPSYTMSAYNNEVFDVNNTRCPTGIFGEIARTAPGFSRSLHPIYSTCCVGKDAEFLVENQSPTTCFGEGSFFDLFSQLDNPYFLMLGINLSVITMCHYYDQRNQAEGRFLKAFDAEIVDRNGAKSSIKFDSYVKDRDFYNNRHTCLARFDALAEQLSLVKRVPFAASWVHGIEEEAFRKLYEACLSVDQTYFLVGTMDEFVDYYRKDNFRLYHGQLDPRKVEEIKAVMVKE